MIYPTKFEAIASLVGGELTQMVGGIIVYHDDQTPPTEAAIDAKLVELKAEWTSQEYARKRPPDYPLMGDQLDMIYKDNKNGTTTHKDAVEAVKAKYPKPE